MSVLTLHTLDSTPETSKALLQSSIDNFGWIPNQSAYMSESPSLLGAYQRAHDLFIDSSLNEEEKAVVWIASGVENNCTYTIQAHSFIALTNGVKNCVVDAIIHDPTKLNARLLALHRFTLEVIHCRGQLNKAAIDAILQAGFNKQSMLDVILGVSQKNMSILLNSIAKTELDERFNLTTFQEFKQMTEV
ncbi:carboxymuconolactone decarboxylase family protein [Iodobacter fluviatilis]|jgi:hypothetical protein|uniref:Carboxymuconolactone decarboxylase n=1 Tax=Iodobacter fluviatilis TaxID=537 RepID=A0A7G3GD74_9NEIS|nr:carboxymuconolactone decarboxylase family protein [Iodobacter fluviatilis]QBC45094.1 carboxymuconolactone decarboxylase [Iodobacter fluviatilis]